ncbi:GAF domain-containing protein [Thermosulfurimonas marina]|uniref:GAF domain-containing protein n=1 Tax=Thermosulfurimonas marina TaxID=2047767 RepID=A0A6H1WRJ5_9BACT|nr:sigma 54-interacting transcriptional regulator [Thermosulfurimonas marina]QJA05780.1 GAF domain-containing protein [Thermosulfurimonas marina]
MSQQSLEEITTLYEIASTLASTLELREALERTLSVLAERFKLKRGTITIFNPRTGEIQIEVAHGLSEEARRRGRYRPGEGITGEVVATGQPIIVPQISEDPRFLNRTRSRDEREKRELSFLCVPIKSGGRVLGTLSVDRPAADVAELSEDLRLLTIVAGLLAQTVAKLQALEEERARLLEENLRLKNELREKFHLENFVATSSRMQEVLEMIDRVAASPATVLLRGESGTGKTLIARLLHYNSPRAEGPFVVVPCTAIPEGLLESELFGYEKGAFTGAASRKIGLMEKAHGGTLFLDEIGDLPLPIQAKLLHAIQEKEFYRLGGTEPLRVDVRLIAATNRNLEDLVAKGLFREDLYYRLSVFPIYLPPLRERPTDIIPLAEHFLEKYCTLYQKKIKRLSSPAIDLLMQYHWPGNVRELENAIERAVLICDEEVIRSYHLPPSLQTAQSSGTRARMSLSEAVEKVERELIVEALKETRGNQTQAAKLLGTTLRVLNYKIKKYGLDPRSFRPPRTKHA